MRVKCPHCRSEFSLDERTDLKDIRCPSCSRSFGVSVEDTQDFAEHSSSDSAHLPPPSRIGRFLLLNKLGRGRGGDVWKARDVELGRFVALKLAPTSTEERSRSLGHASAAQTRDERYSREARLVAQLLHPGIASVYEVGVEGAHVYIAQQFVDGVPLDSWYRNRNVDPSEAAAMCAKIASALEHAHSYGIVHRDVKPRNIVVDDAGAPYLVDFGIARGFEHDTDARTIAGTPAYLAPEQLRGDYRGDPRSDVYGVGLILYELLTGQRAWRGDSKTLIQQILEGAPIAPRRLNPLVPGDQGF